MIYIAKNKLSIINITKEIDNLPLSFYKKTNKYSTYNIYLLKNNKLYGIINMDDILNAYNNNTNIIINKNYQKIQKENYIEIQKIFNDNKHIKYLPLVDDDNHLLGEYRKEDTLINKELNFKNNKYALDFFYDCDAIALVKPNKLFKYKQKYYDEFKKELNDLNIRITEIDKTMIKEVYENNYYILFIDDEECINGKTYYCITEDVQMPEKCINYNDLYENFYKYIINDFLVELYKNVYLLSIIYWPTWTHYFNNLLNDLKVKNTFEDVLNTVYDKDASKEISWLNFDQKTKKGVTYLEDYKSNYYNIKEGERKTFYQPEEYDRTIYFFGPCVIVGSLTKDEDTIESILQKKINDSGYKIKVVNYGAWENPTSEINKIIQTPIKKNDIVILYMNNLANENVPAINLFDVLEKYNVPRNWIADTPVHCNSILNKYYSDEIYEIIKPELDKPKSNERINLDFNILINNYINKYFYKLDLSKYNKIGSIVMNCNPFTLGHRYLIEEALKKVDFLIIFVVEENKSIFSFNTRYACVKEGTKDLENILVVPSGNFIVSNQTFPEYFVKTKDDEITNNIKYDLEIFSKYIAPNLNIKYRFVGEEKNDEVTNEYNILMKEILPKYNIELIEIPRKKINNDFISATKVRKLIEEKNLDELDKYIPKSTKDIIFYELN